MNALTFPILRLLSDGKFHSGEAIAQHFGISRASVWNALQHAESLGIEVFSVRGRGYKLPSAIQLLDKAAVLKTIEIEYSDLQLEVHDHLPSTNSYLMQNMHTYGHGTCVATNLQSQGRGRRGRNWQASLGASLTFSLLWRFQRGAAALSGLSLVVGIALIRSLNALGIDSAKLKWPNDVLIHGEKLAGILIELQGDMEGASTAVIGVGINLKLPDSIKQQIDQPATDLHSIAPQTIDPNQLLGSLLKHLRQVLTMFEQSGFSVFRDEWMQHHAYHQQQVRMLMPDGKEHHGAVIGIAEDGSLLLATADGEQRFISGEVSLRAY